MKLTISAWCGAFMLCVSIAQDAMRPLAAQTSSSQLQRGEFQVSLPVCVNSADDIAEIQHVQKRYHASAKKYEAYRKLLAGDTDLVLATRLAYAETLAANCAGQRDKVLDLVASVIGNRIRLRHGDVGSVVFQRNQFASSLHIYAESRYRDFLCPADRDLWQKAFAKMRVNLEGTAPSAALATDAVNYYLYRHSERFTAPDWQLQEAVVSDSETRACIRVFRNPAWR